MAITPSPPCRRGLRYADGVMDAGRSDMIWVREDHTTGGTESRSTRLSRSRSTARGRSASCNPGATSTRHPGSARIGARLAWLEWNHPLMPWIGCELWVGEITADGSIGGARRIAGGDDELIFQPEWSPDGSLYFVSDRAQDGVAGRWWNLFRVAGDPLAPSSASPVGVAARRGVRTAAVELPHVDLCIRRAAPADLQLYRARRPPAGDGRSRHAKDDLDPDAIPGHLLGARDGRTGLFPRRRADRTAGNRRTRPRIGALPLCCGIRPPQDVDAYRGYLSIAGAGDLRHRQRAAGLRPVLPAAQFRLLRSRRGIAAALGAFPRRPDRRCLTDSELGHAILDEPRLCRARRQLWRQHWLWPRVSPALARQLGH